MRITLISDTHGLWPLPRSEGNLSPTGKTIGEGQQLPPLRGGDLLIHCGDLLEDRNPKEQQQVWDGLEAICESGLYRQVLIVPGNHDLFLESPEGRIAMRELQQHTGGRVKFLVDEGFHFGGYEFWGFPWTIGPGSGRRSHAAFTLPEQADGGDSIERRARMIPEYTDVLISHGPPHGTLGLSGGKQLGSKALQRACGSLKLKLHAFGHVHEQGCSISMHHRGWPQVNCAQWNQHRQAMRHPIEFVL